MGVKGLWRLLMPIGRRISLETLEGQILAIDASIWMTQFLKAMRDPDTGRVQAAAHLMGFFRRICRLRFHGIKPVFVFDGATPEIKLREVALRRKRREQFATVSQAAMQRLAQRLLLQNLQKQKLLQSGKTEGGERGAAMTVAGGAFEAGFQPPEEETETLQEDGKPAAKETGPAAAAASGAAKTRLGEEENQCEGEDESIEAWVNPETAAKEQVNDWDQPIDLVDDDEKQDPNNEDEAERGGFWNANDTQTTTHETDDLLYGISNLHSLAPDKRKDAIEQAKRQQRLQSRQEFMPAAANPLQFSQVQLTNFLRSTKLNKSIADMAVEATKQQQKQQEGASGQQARFELIREKEPNRSDEEEETVRPRPTAALKRQRQDRRGDRSSDNESWGEEQDGKPSASPFVGTKTRNRRVIADDEDENVAAIRSGAGRVQGAFDHNSLSTVENVRQRRLPRGATKPSAIDIGDDRCDEESEEGGFFPAGFASSVKDAKVTPIIAIQDDGDSESEAAGGFLRTNLDEDVLVARRKGVIGNVSTDDAAYAQELEDRALAQALQDEEDADAIAGEEMVHVALHREIPVHDATSVGASDHIGNPNMDDSDEEDEVGWEDGEAENMTDVLETDVLETDVLETDVLETDVLETDVLETDVLETDVLEASTSGKEIELERVSVHDLSPGVETSVYDHESADRDFAQALQDSEDATALTAASQKSMSAMTRRNAEEPSQLSHDLDRRQSALKGGPDLTPVNDDSDAGDEGELSWEEGDGRQSSQAGDLGGGDWAAPSKAWSGVGGEPENNQGGISADATAALERAAATASNLADWAGRVFRRAVKEANGSDTATPPKKLYAAEPREPHGDYDDEQPSFTRAIRQAVAAPVATAKSATQRDRSVRQAASTSVSTAPVMYEQSLQDIEAAIKENEAQWTAERHSRERDADTVTDEMREEAIQLLQLFGVPYVIAPAEAEAQCATLEALGLVDGVVTEDSDVFAFGGDTVYKNIFEERKYAEVYKSGDAAREMSLGRNQMVALAMMLGGDYSEGINGVGIVNGLEILEAFDVSQNLREGLQRFRRWLDGFSPFEQDIGSQETSVKVKVFHTKHSSARTRWIAPDNFPAEDVMQAYLNPVVDTSKDRFSWGTPDIEKLLLFCNKNMGWRPADTKALLDPVTEKLTGGMRQTRIDSFMKYEDSIKFANVRSKRLREVLGLNKEGKTVTKKFKNQLE